MGLLEKWEHIYQHILPEDEFQLSDDLRAFLESTENMHNKNVMDLVADRIIAYCESMDEMNRTEQLKSFLRLYQDTQEAIFEEERKQGLEDYYCHQGCWKCCTQPVKATELESQLIKEFVSEKKISIDKEKVKKHNSLLEEGLKSFSDWKESMNQEQRKCVFLSSEGTCSIYEVRPLNCRNFFALGTDKFCAEDTSTMAEQDTLDARIVRHFELGVLSTVLATLQGGERSVKWLPQWLK